METEDAKGRSAKGPNMLELVRFVRHTMKERRLSPPGPKAQALLAERILPTQWYPHDAFIELVEYTFDHVLGRNEAAASEMGATGARSQLQGPYKAFWTRGDPRSSLLSLRHVWRIGFNFGALRTESDSSGVTFFLSGYEDVRASHGFMVAGWAAGAAQLAGVPRATAQILDRPWKGARELVYRVAL